MKGKKHQQQKFNTPVRHTKDDDKKMSPVPQREHGVKNKNVKQLEKEILSEKENLSELESHLDEEPQHIDGKSVNYEEEEESEDEESQSPPNTENNEDPIARDNAFLMKMMQELCINVQANSETMNQMKHSLMYSFQDQEAFNKKIQKQQEVLSAEVSKLVNAKKKKKKHSSSSSSSDSSHSDSSSEREGSEKEEDGPEKVDFFMAETLRRVTPPPLPDAPLPRRYRSGDTRFMRMSRGKYVEKPNTVVIGSEKHFEISWKKKDVDSDLRFLEEVEEFQLKHQRTIPNLIPMLDKSLKGMIG